MYLWASGKEARSAVRCSARRSGGGWLTCEVNWDKPAAGFISYADDFMISTKQADVSLTWDKTVEPLKEVGLETDEATSNHQLGN